MEEKPLKIVLSQFPSMRVACYTAHGGENPEVEAWTVMGGWAAEHIQTGQLDPAQMRCFGYFHTPAQNNSKTDTYTVMVTVPNFLEESGSIQIKNTAAFSCLIAQCDFNDADLQHCRALLRGFAEKKGVETTFFYPIEEHVIQPDASYFNVILPVIKPGESLFLEP